MLDAMEFISKNPFPEDGKEQTKEIVKLLKTLEGPEYEKMKMKLFKVNAATVYLTFKQHSYNQNLDSIMSFMWEGLDYCIKNYDLESIKPFYSYWMSYVRGLLQKHYNYNETLVHVPVMKKKQTVNEFSSIDMYNDLMSDKMGTNPFVEDNEEDYDILWELIEEFMKTTNMSKEARENHELAIKAIRYEKITDAARDMNVSHQHMRNIVNNFQIALNKFREFKKKIVKVDYNTSSCES